MILVAQLKRLNIALDHSKELTDRKIKPVEKPGEKNERDTFCPGKLPDVIQEDSPG